MRYKNITIVLMLVLFAVSFGYGLGRGISPQTQEMTSVVHAPPLHAASSDKKSELANIFVEISKKMVPSVVNIYTTSTIRAPWGGPGGQDEMWRRFFEEFFGEGFNATPGGPGMPSPKAQSLGSGFIIETSNTGGLILTNNHVVEGADEIRVKFTEKADEPETKAEIVGQDPDLDIALLKVKTRNTMQAANLSDSSKLEVGEWIAAVGNPFGHGHSVSHGIVSAKERTLPGSFANYLQVDAPINPGNSGGPLVNLNGEVVGINNAIDARGPGIGFAIPINLVKDILPQLKTKGRVERGYIGVSVDDLRPDLAKSLKLDENTKAPIITNVMPGTPAAKAGLQVYDVIKEVNGKPIHNANELVAAITAVPVGENAKVKILRSGKEMAVGVMVARRPDFRRDRGRVKPDGTPSKPQKKKSGRPDTGMEIEEISPETPELARQLGLPESFRGIVISQVRPGSPAFNAGLERGDVILEVDRKAIKSEEEFDKIVRSKKTYLLRVRKQDENGRETFAVIALKLAAMDEE
ncbi:MAG: Do family serine endopeptidase [Bdellovibrionota bacterium]